MGRANIVRRLYDARMDWNGWGVLLNQTSKTIEHEPMHFVFEK